MLGINKISIETEDEHDPVLPLLRRCPSSTTPAPFFGDLNNKIQQTTAVLDPLRRPRLLSTLPHLHPHLHLIPSRPRVAHQGMKLCRCIAKIGCSTSPPPRPPPAAPYSSPAFSVSESPVCQLPVDVTFTHLRVM